MRAYSFITSVVGDYTMDALKPVALVFSLACAITCPLAQASDNALSVVPKDAIAFAVVHNLEDASRSLGDVVKLLHGQSPDLLGMAKAMTGFQKGLNEQGDLVVVLSAVDPAPKFVMLVPVSDFTELFSTLNTAEPTSGVAEVQLAGKPMLIGRKGDHAAIAPPSDREALERYLKTTDTLANDATIRTWIESNKASLVVTSRGIKQLLPKLVSGIKVMQEQVRKVGGDNARAGADAMNLYIDLFNAAEAQVDQFGIGLRIDAARTVDVVKRVQFKEGGRWAQTAAEIQPANVDLLAGLEAKPFVLAGGGVVPEKAMQGLVNASVKMMQNQPMYKLTPEQAKKYAELSVRSMSGLRSMRMLMGVPDAEKGMYSDTTVVMTVDDAKQYMDSYAKTLAEMRELAKQAGEESAIPAATTKPITVGEIDGLEISMGLPHLKQFTAPSGPDPEKMMKLIAGPDGKLTIYVAPADDHTVIMAYTSLENLQKSISFYESKEPGLSADPSVKKTASSLPEGSQVVAYASLGGMIKLVRQFASTVPGVSPPAIPDVPESPPLGMAAKFNASGVEGHLMVPADTLKAIGQAVQSSRRAKSTNSSD
jgi:hypothetical protein